MKAKTGGISRRQNAKMCCALAAPFQERFEEFTRSANVVELLEAAHGILNAIEHRQLSFKVKLVKRSR